MTCTNVGATTSHSTPSSANCLHDVARRSCFVTGSQLACRTKLLDQLYSLHIELLIHSDCSTSQVRFARGRTLRLAQKYHGPSEGDVNTGKIMSRMGIFPQSIGYETAIIGGFLTIIDKDFLSHYAWLHRQWQSGASHAGQSSWCRG